MLCCHRCSLSHLIESTSHSIKLESYITIFSSQINLAEIDLDKVKVSAYCELCPQTTMAVHLQVCLPSYFLAGALRGKVQGGSKSGWLLPLFCSDWGDTVAQQLGGRAGPPWHFWPRNFCWPTGKRGKEKRENGEAKKENQKRESRKLKMEAGKRVTKWGEDLLFFIFLFFFFFLLSLKFVLGLPKLEFCTGKSIHTGKKIRKNDFAPSEKYSSYAPGETS